MITVMLDDNEDMHQGDVHQFLAWMQLHEAIMNKHGCITPSTYRHNNSNAPTDGIWVTPGVEVQVCGYSDFDEVFPGTDHRTLWMDLTFTVAFRHNMPPIIKPLARRLQCSNPCSVDNYNRYYEGYLREHNLLTCASMLESISTYPITLEAKEYELLDSFHCKGVARAEWQCQKLHMGQVSFSPALQQASQKIYRLGPSSFTKPKALKSAPVCFHALFVRHLLILMLEV